MLNIKINEDYKITSSEDGKNIMIEKQIYKKDEFDIEEPTGKFKVDGYFGTVQSAIKGLIKRQLNHSNATSFDELIAEMECIEQNIIDAMHQMNM